ncbi:sigma-70 family RNA polymerase sigma factor [Flammeovirga sp. EKP202]|uniref:sigma-70 family RNA polymerase sigma factor n=1 Tax=Flammeovirga sp. EKP202 TaxID=2770592 RepID=UPI00165F1332|nr:sigma-70 family RNA polymerase sigma factor [Flammeovirga sp. EKP202]MBD0400859.1 sigma-70 family RNA polymerase sigma factor [Flammeovirga sp. EKP202]
MDTVDNVSEWVNDYSDELFAWALKRTQNVHLSEDLVQDTFVAAYQSVERYKGESSPKTWLHSILKHKMMDHFRKEKVKEKYENQSAFFQKNESWDKHNNPTLWSTMDVTLLDNPGFNEAFASCLEKLPQKWKTAVVGKYLTDKKADDICKELSITTSNYWQIVHRAKLNLRNCIELNWFQD